ncbi:MAG: SDR family NAD(P)-dependent oxidoreductase [Parachlamydiaceae bacterium]|nr:SDR family NAD(P)-dependent oxidoreductase [Parachlamydiaceae bacterium]
MKEYPSLALVTGATSGIGKALCHLLAEKGIALIASGRDVNLLQNLKNDLQSKVNVQLIVADLTKKDERQKLIEQIHTFAPDLVINNAGFGLYGDCLTYQTSEQMQILEVDGVALLEITLEAARSLLSKEKKGTIFNISSAAAFQIFPGMAVYAATKAFVNQFSQAFDKEMEVHGIRILTTCPGMVNTNFQARASHKNSDSAADIGVMTPEYVAESIWKQIESQKPLTIIDWKYHIMNCVSYLVPTSLIIRIIRKNILNRIQKRNLIKINEI